MSVLSNSKVMLGAALVCLILSAPMSILSTGAVEGAVEDNFETFPTDNACADDDYRSRSGLGNQHWRA